MYSVTGEALTINSNPWRVPSIETAFDGWWEGRPTEAQRQKVLRETEAARKAWKPSADAFTLVEDLRTFVGGRTVIQMWDPIMVLLNEGPHPFAASCKRVVIQEVGGFLQAFVEVCEVKEIETPDGYSPMGFLRPQEGSDCLLAPVSDLYSISKISSKPE